ncbi:MAG: 2-oxo acid dehydrogenase, partial [Deltaproteobacteria bacterium]|nr:2-oxo acid dehydrogenase [Deltaproteobacteria bacterium]
MGNVELKPYHKPSMWRRMSLANWRSPADPQVYGRMELDLSRALAWARETGEAAGIRVTPTHLVARATAVALARQPACNVLIRWNRVYER